MLTESTATYPGSPAHLLLEVTSQIQGVCRERNATKLEYFTVLIRAPNLPGGFRCPEGQEIDLVKLVEHISQKQSMRKTFNWEPAHRMYIGAPGHIGQL